MPLKKLSFSFKKLPEVGLVMNAFLLILVFALITVFYLGGRFYLADVNFRQALMNSEQAIQKMVKTVSLNGYREDYRRALSQVYLSNAWAEANKPQAEQDVQLLQAYIAGSIEQARIVVGQSPDSVVTWENLAAIYRDSRGLIGGAQPFAVEAFVRATELEPTNPFFYRELCRLSLVEEQVDWDKTVSYCQKSVDLKENYLDAHIQLALAYEQKGDLEIAVEQMEKVLSRLQGVSFERGSDLAGAATEIYFQLGRLHFNLDQIDEAIRMFEQAVIVTPQYANARYALGLSYQSAGRDEDALIQFKLVDQLVPGNEIVQSVIQQLESQPEAEID
jgi:tetratricopeptide (TPR) repeat protein